MTPSAPIAPNRSTHSSERHVSGYVVATVRAPLCCRLRGRVRPSGRANGRFTAREATTCAHEWDRDAVPGRSLCSSGRGNEPVASDGSQ